MAAIAADATLPEDVRWKASYALALAASPRSERGYEVEGTPYPRAFDPLVRVYESGNNPALGDIWSTFPERGRAYVRELFERSEPPPICQRYGLQGISGLLECEGYKTSSAMCAPRRGAGLGAGISRTRPTRRGAGGSSST